MSPAAATTTSHPPRTLVADLIATGSRVILGALFVWAAVSKSGDMASFAEEVADYQMLPARLVPVAAAAMPGIEALCGLVLIVGVWARASALVISGLLAVFIAALTQSLLRGIDLRCGCFGGSDAATWGTVWRDVAMLALGAAVLWLGPGRLRLSWPRRPATI